MRKQWWNVVAFMAAACGSASLWAADVTLDLNGFANTLGGQVTGPGLAKPIKIEIGAKTVELKDLQAGAKYGVDFFHNSGPEGSDFIFSVNEAGTGVAKVDYVGKVAILKGFEAGAKTLVLDTHPIVYNANGGQSGAYYILGLCVAQPPESEPLKVMAVPGAYSVDNLFNPGGGVEDFSIFVDGKGNVQPLKGSEEYVECDGAKVNVRTATVRFKIEASQDIARHESHVQTGVTLTENFVTQLDLKVPVGGGGVNIWNFGTNTVGKSDAIDGFGKPVEGKESKNDFLFQPRLRYDVKTKVFYFETAKGRAPGVFAEVSGMTDDDSSEMSVKITATILSDKDQKAVEKGQEKGK